MTVSSASVLAAADFQAAALASVSGCDHPVAVFDCDGTLWSGDAGSGFMRWTIAHGLLSPEAVAWIKYRYQGYLSGQVNELAICGQMVQVYRGLTEATMRAAAREFFATEIEHRIFPEMQALIADMQSRSVEIWAVSSTNNWVIEEGVRRYNIPADRVLAARVAIENGIVTERLLDVPTDDGKAASLDRIGIAEPHAVFANSIHDAAMLSLARGVNGSNGSFPVNPTPALLELAATRQWPVYYPASVAPASGYAPEAVVGELPVTGEPRG